MATHSSDLPDAKLKAIYHRLQGESIRDVADRIGVSNSTVSAWWKRAFVDEDLLLEVLDAYPDVERKAIAAGAERHGHNAEDFLESLRRRAAFDPSPTTEQMRRHNEMREEFAKSMEERYTAVADGLLGAMETAIEEIHATLEAGPGPRESKSYWLTSTSAALNTLTDKYLLLTGRPTTINSSDLKMQGDMRHDHDHKHAHVAVQQKMQQYEEVYYRELEQGDADQGE